MCLSRLWLIQKVCIIHMYNWLNSYTTGNCQKLWTAYLFRRSYETFSTWILCKSITFIASFMPQTWYFHVFRWIPGETDSELRVRLAPLNRFKPSSKIFYWPFQGGTSFVDLLCFCSVLCLLCFVRVCLYVLCGHLLGKGWPLGSRLWCLLWVCHFPIGILGQVWYLIVSIPDLCNLITFLWNKICSQKIPPSPKP